MDKQQEQAATQPGEGPVATTAITPNEPATGTEATTATLANEPATDAGTTPIIAPAEPPTVGITGSEPEAIVEVPVSQDMEFEVTRVDDEPVTKGNFVFGRATYQHNASNELVNEAWGGKEPRGFVELVIADGPLLNVLKAGMRMRLTITPLQPGTDTITM